MRDMWAIFSLCMVRKMPETLEKHDIEKAELDKNILKVCFVCTGNTCRSPMAAALLNHYGKGNYHAESAGILAIDNQPISPNAEKALQNAGIPPLEGNDYTRHLSRRLNLGIIESCDKIVAISASHAMAIIQSFPICATKITHLERDISDPFGQDIDVYSRCLEEIKECIKNMFLLDMESDNGNSNA